MDIQQAIVLYSSEALERVLEVISLIVHMLCDAN